MYVVNEKNLAIRKDLDDNGSYLKKLIFLFLSPDLDVKVESVMHENQLLDRPTLLVIFRLTQNKKKT